MDYCTNGHDLTVPDAVYTDPAGYKHCRQCKREQALASYYRRKAKRAAEAEGAK